MARWDNASQHSVLDVLETSTRTAARAARRDRPTRTKPTTATRTVLRSLDAGKVEDGDAATARTDLDGDGARRRELPELRTVVGDDRGLAGSSPEVSSG
jgi:hypothetical protein